MLRKGNAAGYILWDKVHYCNHCAENIKNSCCSKCLMRLSVCFNFSFIVQKWPKYFLNLPQKRAVWMLFVCFDCFDAFAAYASCLLSLCHVITHFNVYPGSFRPAATVTVTAILCAAKQLCANWLIPFYVLWLSIIVLYSFLLNFIFEFFSTNLN